MRYFHVFFKFAIPMFMSCHKLRVLRKRGRLQAHSRAPGPSHSNANTLINVRAYIRFVKNFTLPDFQAKHFTPLFSPKFNSFGDKNTEK